MLISGGLGRIFVFKRAIFEICIGKVRYVRHYQKILNDFLIAQIFCSTKTR